MTDRIGFSPSFPVKITQEQEEKAESIAGENRRAITRLPRGAATNISRLPGRIGGDSAFRSPKKSPRFQRFQGPPATEELKSEPSAGGGGGGSIRGSAAFIIAKASNSHDATDPEVTFLNDFNDVTHTRGSEAAFVDPRVGWLFQSVSGSNWLETDVPRIFSDGAILIESEATNIQPDSRNPLAGSWIAGTDTTTTAAASDGPDGAVDTGTRHEVLSGGLSQRDNLVVAANSTCTFSEYIGGVGNAHGTTSGTSIVGTRLSPATGSQWTRSIGTVTLTSGDTSVGIVPVDANDLFGGTAANRDAITDLHQVEVSAFASSPIRTDGAIASRSIDIAAIDGTTLHSDISTVGFEFDYWPNFDEADVATHYFFWSTSDDRLWIASTGVNFRADGVTVTVAGLSFSAGDKLTIRADFAGNLTVFVNGSSQGSAGISGDWTDVASDATCWFGSDGTSNAIDGVMSKWRAL